MSPPSELLLAPSPPSATPFSASASEITIISKSTIYPDERSTITDLRLSVSDLPMLSCHYIQKGLLLPRPPISIGTLLVLLTRSLSRALSLFPTLAGRLVTLPDASIHITCNDAGVPFLHATASAPSLTLTSLLLTDSDVPLAFKSFFALDGAVSYNGHSLPLAAFQLTELADGAVFIGSTVNHAVVDGTSFWHFFNSWAAICCGGGGAAPAPDFRRNYFGGSRAVLSFPAGGGGPEVTFSVDAPLRERIFHFTRDAILDLKSRANKSSQLAETGTATISSFQSLCAQLWISVTRARKQLAAEAETTFRMAVNCRHRIVPPVDAHYFGNAIQSIPTAAMVGEVRAADLRWTAAMLNRNVAGHVNARVRRGVAEWEAAPRCFPLGNPNGACITMGSSPRFPMYNGNDFGWGEPVAVRSGRANKFDGKISAFPGREGGGSVDLEVCLAPEGMAALIEDGEFMSYVSGDRQPEAMVM